MPLEAYNTMPFVYAPDPDASSIHKVDMTGDVGIWAFKRPEDTYKRELVGGVWLWGTVIEHEHGYRAQYAYPAFFVVPSSVRRRELPVGFTFSDEGFAHLINLEDYIATANRYEVPIFEVEAWDDFVTRPNMQERLLFPSEMAEP